MSHLLLGNVFTRSLTISAAFLGAAVWGSSFGQRAWEDEFPSPELNWVHQNKKNLLEVKTGAGNHVITGIDSSVRPKSLANKLIESIYLFKTLCK